jgi:hypothetical protein
MSADYDGWADQREEEREALDQLVDVALPPAVRACGAFAASYWSVPLRGRSSGRWRHRRESIPEQRNFVPQRHSRAPVPREPTLGEPQTGASSGQLDRSAKNTEERYDHGSGTAGSQTNALIPWGCESARVRVFRAGCSRTGAYGNRGKQRRRDRQEAFEPGLGCIGPCSRVSASASRTAM